jgi:hypothetical protein
MYWLQPLAQNRPPLPGYRVLARVALGMGLLLLMAGCDGISAPRLRSSEPHDTVAADGSDPAASQCQELRDQIRANQESVREAPATSTSPQIVAAAEGKADQRIDELRSRLDGLNCAPDSSDTSTRLHGLPPLPPAPGAPNP